MFVRCGGKELALEYAYTEKERGVGLSQGTLKKRDLTSSGKQNKPLIMWHSFSFELPERPVNMWYPYHLHLEQSGNGFIYVNGHCIGRCWQEGPQREYYIPECWLNIGGKNILTISLRPTEVRSGIKIAEIIPVTWVAEKR